MTTVKAIKNKMMKVMTSSFERFPPIRQLSLCQHVLHEMCDALPDTENYTLSQICDELAQQVHKGTFTEEEIEKAIECADLEGRMSGKLLDEKDAAVDSLKEAQAQRRVLDAQVRLDAERAATVAAKAKRDADEAKTVKAKRASVKRVLCGTCGGDQGACDCEAVAKRQAEKKASKEAAKRAQEELEEEDDSDDDDEEAEEIDEDDDDDIATQVSGTSFKPKSTGSHSDLDNPRFILDPREWIQLSRKHSQTDLSTALRFQYRTVFDCAPHDALFVVGQWLSHAATIRAMPVVKASNLAIGQAIHGIEACRARMEFHLGKKAGHVNAAAVEAELMDQSLPTDLRKARKAGRTAQKEVLKDTPTPAPKPAAKKGGKKSEN